MGTQISVDCECGATATGEFEGTEGEFTCDICGALFVLTVTQLTRPDQRQRSLNS